jgi:hypothetical protein
MYVIKPTTLTLSTVSEAENDAPLWASQTTYQTGASVIKNSVVYVSTISGNKGLDPELEVQELEGVRWLRKSVTNIYKFLDGSPSTSTVGVSPLVIEVTPEETYSAIALLNLRGSIIKVESITGGIVKLMAITKSGPELVDNWFSWLSSSFHRRTDRVIFADVSGFAGSTIRITIEGPNPALGEMVVGRKVKIGNTKLDPSSIMRRRTFTNIVTNDFGDVFVTKRAIARDVTYSVIADREGFDARADFLDSVDGVRVVTYAEAEGWDQLINRGFITDWSLPVDLPNNFSFEITTQGVS